VIADFIYNQQSPFFTNRVNHPINRPFLWLWFIAIGTIMKTGGKVQGSAIIESPATYATTNQER